MGEISHGTSSFGVGNTQEAKKHLSRKRGPALVQKNLAAKRGSPDRSGGAKVEGVRKISRKEKVRCRM